MKNILIIEDDKAIQTLLKVALKQEGYKTYSAQNAQEGIDFLVKNIIDLVILDLGLPDIDGTEVIDIIRSFGEQLPVIVVSARSSEEEKIKCFDKGANDYVQKPFSTQILLARIRSQLRHSNYQKDSPIFINGSLKIDFISHTVYLDDKEVHLTNYEYKLLALLAQNVGKTLTQNFIISKIWGVEGNDTGNLRVFMAGIRRKIEKDLYSQEFIRTDVGVGYRMNKIEN